MEDITYINGRILERSKGQIKLTKKNFRVLGGRFFFVEKKCEIIGKVINLENKIIFPAFINCHVHLGESLFKGLDGKWDLETYIKFTEWWNQKLGGTRDEAWLDSASLTLINSLKNGISTICTARGETLMGDYQILGYSGYPVMKSKKLSSYLEDFELKFDEFKSRTIKNINVIPGIFLHSLYTNDENSLKKVKNAMENGAAFITSHIAEDKKSLEKSKQIWGESEISILNKYNLLSERTLLVHCGLLKKEELLKVANSKSKIIICPVSNKMLQTKTPKIEILDKYGINWCLGTDGLGTGKSLDPIFHLKQFYLMNKRIPLERLLSGFLWGAAEVLNLKEVGEIKEGFKANFIIFEKQIFETNIKKVLKNIIFSKNIKRTLYLEGEVIRNPSHVKKNSYYIPNKMTMKKAIKIMEKDKTWI